MCCKLDMCLEGGKEAGNLFYIQQAHIMVDKITMNRCVKEPNLYGIEYPNGSWVYVGVFVDNLLILPSDKLRYDAWLKEYKSHYTVTGGGPVSQFVGCAISRDLISGTYTVNQAAYIERSYLKFCGTVTKPKSSPVDTGQDGAKKFMALQLASTEAERLAMSGKDFLSLIGTLAYITNQTRPDCQFHTSWLGQFMANPTIHAYDAGLVVLSYLYKTRHLGLTYGGPVCRPEFLTDPHLDSEQFFADCGLHVGSDASHGSTRSHGGHVVMYVNAAICWSSRRIRPS